MTIANNVINGATAEGIDVNLNAGTTGTLTLAITGNSWNPAGTHTGNAVDINRAAGTLNLNFSGNTNILSANAHGGRRSTAAPRPTRSSPALPTTSIHGNTAGAGVSIANATFDAVPGGGGSSRSMAARCPSGPACNPVGAAGLVLSPVLGSLSFADLDVFAGTSGLTAGRALA